MSILSDYEELVDATITNKTEDFSITPQNVGDMLKELAEIVPDLASSQSVPMGTILMYSPVGTAEFDATGLGVADNVLGWAICNGNNTTPNLKGKFVVGYDPADPDYDTIGETGGDKEITDVIEHTHYVAANVVVESTTSLTSSNNVAYSYDTDNINDYVLQGTATSATIGKTSATGVSTIDNRPPYYVVLYIKKIA